MKRTQRFAVFALMSTLMLAIALPAFATQDSTEGESTETTVTAEHDHLAPAVPAPPPEEVDEEQPWTARFIYPTIVAVTVILLIGLAIGYNRSIKKRYTVVG